MDGFNWTSAPAWLPHSSPGFVRLLARLRDRLQHFVDGARAAGERIQGQPDTVARAVPIARVRRLSATDSSRRSP